MRDDERRPTEEYAVMSDEPVVLEKPRQAVAKVAIAYMVAILVVGASSAYIGYGLASRDTRRGLAAVERYQVERREARDRERERADAERAETEARVQRLRQIVCVFADRAQPRDADVERIRAEFGCTGNPGPVGGGTTGAMPAPPGGRPGPGQPAPGPPRGGASVPGQPAPAPQPPPVVPPPDEPEPDEGDGLICLPIIGCII